MKPAAALAALALFLCACVENQEEIVVRPDGSASVEIRAKGKPADLADGYAVPFGAPWTADGDASREWIRLLGADTGGASVRANLDALGGKSAVLRPDEEIELAARADFASVKDLPRWLAPESEPFRTAYLERTADLRVERKGGRTIYVFERTYRARTFERLDILSRLKASLDEKVFEKIEDEVRLDDAERSQVVDAALAAMRGVPEAFASDAVLSIYTHGDASLSPAAAQRVLESVRAAIASVVTRERLERIAAGLLPSEGHEEDEEAGKDLERLEDEVRQALRSAFARALESESLPLAARNALRGELEWLITARDHTDDLGDEAFAVRVTLPGTIVGGNFDGIEDGAAAWKFDGADLRDRDRVLRVVSVVE